MKKFLYLLAFLPALGFAQTRDTPCSPTTPPNAVCLSHGAVVTRVDGLPTIFPVLYRVEQKLGTGQFTVVSTDNKLNHLIANLAPGDYTFQVFAIEQSLVSDASNSVSKSIVQSKPQAPVLIIALTIQKDGPPIFRRIATFIPRVGETIVALPAEYAAIFR